MLTFGFYVTPELLLLAQSFNTISVGALEQYGLSAVGAGQGAIQPRLPASTPNGGCSSAALSTLAGQNAYREMAGAARRFGGEFR